MIWYILYPFRGTTEAPVLPPTHPLRLAFSRYGKHAARHVVTTLLTSVAVASFLIYPIPFIFTNDFINGASNLPHHVWTVAQPLDYAANAEPDVTMRSIWVHGSYMAALNRDVLLGALELQDELLGPTLDFSPRQTAAGDGKWELDDPGRDLTLPERDAFHVINGLTRQSWFFHSPLQYWSGSADKIRADTDIVSTVNSRKTQSTSVNVTLRHSIVFSGKRFANRQLLAADALVITLIHLRDSPVARQWARKAKSLPSHLADKWTLYPPDGQSMPSRLYKFQFRPISVQDTAVLALAYALALVYFLFSLSKLRAVKSRVGLIVTVMVQIAVSVMSSFTVCAVLGVDLSRIPRVAYPLVVLSLSLENVCRLINAVIMTPAEESTGSRMGQAFGDTAHVALASSAQNMLILWALSLVVSPGVSAFCLFAVVAIVFDFFYLSTFFLAVLSVDVRRMELSESLAKASLTIRGHQGGEQTAGTTSWAESVFPGGIATTTRVAGTMVIVCFVLIAQWHFLGNEPLSGMLARLFQVPGITAKAGASSPLSGIHQARSPTSWLRLQDHETAQEVINVIKPWAHSYIAEVYEPLVFVLRNADRMPDAKERPFLPAAYDFIRLQRTPFMVTVFFVLAAVRLLTNYLLWEREADNGDADLGDDSLLSIQSLEGGHLLDVALLTASPNGRVVSIGLDRRIYVWEVRLGTGGYNVRNLEKPKQDPFPILAVTVDDKSRFVAFLSPSHVLVWDCESFKWLPPVAVDAGREKPEGFFFLPGLYAQLTPPMAVVRRNGVLTHISSVSADWTVCADTIICASLLVCRARTQPSFVGSESESPNGLPQSFSILTASRGRGLHVTSLQDKAWSTCRISHAGTNDMPGDETYQLLPVPALNAVLAVGGNFARLLDIANGELIHAFFVEPIHPRSMRMTCLRRPLARSGLGGLLALTLAYVGSESGDCVIQTYAASKVDGNAALGNRDRKGAIGGTQVMWLDVPLVKKHVKSPGIWELLATGDVIGVRKIERPPSREERSGVGEQGGLRRRRSAQNDARLGNVAWEVWLASQPERLEAYETRPLMQDEEDEMQLLISDVGPIVRVGRNSVAVGVGNTVKVVSVGHGVVTDADEDLDKDGIMKVGGRRRKNGSSGAKVKTCLQH